MLDFLYSIDIATFITQRGWFLTYSLVFLGGLALNLTPCVYPLIPVTIGIFGGYDQDTKRHIKLLMAVLYVFGISITYSLLGLTAAITGHMLGEVLQSPIVLVIISLVMIVLAGYQFGLGNLQLPLKWMQKASFKTRGLRSLVMGLTVGFVAAPCLGPFVLALLTFVAKIQDPVQGFILFFILALGLGLPYLFLAYYSSLLSALPKSGQWLVWVKKAFGFLLFEMALYFITPLLPSYLVVIMTILIFLSSGIYLGLIEGSIANARLFWKTLGRVFCVITIIISVGIFWQGTTKIPSPKWVKGNFKDLASLVAKDQPVMVDLTAKWCIACKEFDEHVFSDRNIISKSKYFKMIKIDLTNANDIGNKEYIQIYDIKGLPSILFFNNGKELKNLRINSLVPIEKMLKAMNATLIDQ